MGVSGMGECGELWQQQGRLGNRALHKNKRHVMVFGGFCHVVVMYENLRFKIFWNTMIQTTSNKHFLSQIRRQPKIKRSKHFKFGRHCSKQLDICFQVQIRRIFSVVFLRFSVFLASHSEPSS